MSPRWRMHGHADLRSLLLLALAIVPILVTGWYSLNQWRDTGRQLAEVRAAIGPVTAMHYAHELFDRVGRAELLFEAAALPDAPEEVVELANLERSILADDLQRSVDGFRSHVSAFAQRAGQTDELMLGVVESATGLSEFAVRGHEIGQPSPPMLGLLGGPSRDGLAGLAPFVLRSGVEDLSEHEHLLSELMTLNDAHDVDLLMALRGEADPGALLHGALRLPNWDESIQQWTLDFRQLSAETELNEALSFGRLASTDNPLTPPIVRLAGGDLSPSSERDGALLAALENDVDLAAHRDGALRAFIDATEASETKLLNSRRLAGLAGAAMTALALILLWLIGAEISERRRVAHAHERALGDLADQANSDALTDLHNRRWLDEQLPRMLEKRSPSEEVVVAYLDVDRFKTINDVWGHHNGDLILRVVSSRLRQATSRIPGMEMVRFGGDEFVAIATMAASISDSELHSIGAELLAAFDDPVTLDGRQHDIESSIGISISDANSTVHSLLVDADLSMLQAKRSGRGRVVVDKRGAGRAGELVQVIPMALANGEFWMDLQPVVDAWTGEVHHYEALARWTRANGEEIPPSVFVPLVESFGLADDLTKAMFEMVAELRRAQGSTLPRVWINVAPVEFNSPDLGERLLSRLAELGLPASAVGIEMTERAAIGDLVGVEDELEKLRSNGVKVAIDDFGAGYSPLGHLRDMPVDILKIDRALIAGIDRDVGGQQIVRGIIGFARSLGLTLVAEGVEEEAELHLLRSEGIDLVQGWLTGRPGPPSEVLHSHPVAKLETG